MLNLYGFLEHNPSDDLLGIFKSVYDNVVTPEETLHYLLLIYNK